MWRLAAFVAAVWATPVVAFAGKAEVWPKSKEVNAEAPDIETTWADPVNVTPVNEVLT